MKTDIPIDAGWLDLAKPFAEELGVATGNSSPAAHEIAQQVIAKAMRSVAIVTAAGRDPAGPVEQLVAEHNARANRGPAGA